MKKTYKHDLSSEFSVYFLSCLLSIVTFFIFVPIVICLSNNVISLEEYSKRFLPFLIPQLQPEQDERNIFILGCFSFPILIYFYSSWIDNRKEKFLKLFRLIPIIFYALVGIIIYYLLYTNDLQQDSITFFSIASSFPIVFALGTLILSFDLFKSYKWVELLLNSKIVFSVLIGVVAVFALSGSLMRLAPNNDFFYNHFHFSAVFNSVVMVHQGKTLLTDVINTYGLYPHILSPIFKVFELTPSSFCSVMALILLFSLTLLILVINKNLHNKWLKIIGSIAIIEAVCFYRPHPISNDFYLQYVPIRILFPSLVLFFSSLYFNSKKKAYYFLTFFVASIGPLWNQDSGIISLIAWYGTLFVYELSTCSTFEMFVKQYWKHLFTGIVTLATTLLTFTFWINFSTGKYPDFSNYFLIQQLFYKYGYYMIRAPLWHVWMLYIATCIAGVTLSVKTVREKNVTPSSLVLCVLTIITTGAFSYYQGRSASSNLIGPGYLAILLLIFLSDLLWSHLVKIRKLNTLTFIMFYICFTPIAFCSINYFSHQKNALVDLYSQQIVPQTVNDLTLSTQLKKYSNLVRANEKTLVFSLASGSVHLFTKTQSYAFDSFSELFLIKDYAEIESGIRKKLCRILYVERGFALLPPHLQPLIDLNYHVIAHVENTSFDIMEAN